MVLRRKFLVFRELYIDKAEKWRIKVFTSRSGTMIKIINSKKVEGRK